MLHDDLPLVSIIITNHNYGRFLAESIHSALNQNYPNTEIIVVDDGSTDESHLILEKYKPFIKLLFTDHNGQCSAINTGFSASQGEYVVFLDADDYLTRECVQQHLENFTQNPTICKSQGYMQCVNRHGVHINKTIPFKLTDTGFYRDKIIKHGPWAIRHAWTSGNAWRREFLSVALPLPESTQSPSSPDGCLNALSALYGPIGAIDKTLAYYRIHGDNKGPISDVFTLSSIDKRLSKMKHNFLFIQQRAADFDIDVPFSYWWKWKSSWRSNLALQAAFILNNSQPKPTFHQVVLSPFKGRNKNILVSASICLLIAGTYCLPEKARLTVTQRLLRLKASPETVNL